jgi:hypothetical protein
VNRHGGTGRWPILVGGETLVLLAVLALLAAVCLGVAADLAAG